MDPALGAFGLAFLALLLSTLHRRRERAASRSLPKANVDEANDGTEPEEDKTHVFKPAERPTVRPPPRPPQPIDAEPLAGVPLERPTSSATRTAEAFGRRTTQPRTSGDDPEKGSV
jgi:hypothetical protein